MYVFSYSPFLVHEFSDCACIILLVPLVWWDWIYRSEPYDPYLPRGGGATPGPSQGNAKTAAIQAQIDDTVGIMRENITKVAERGERLDQLQDKTGEFTLSCGLRCCVGSRSSFFAVASDGGNDSGVLPPFFLVWWPVCWFVERVANRFVLL